MVRKTEISAKLRLIALCRSDRAQTVRRSLAGPLIGNNLERNLLSLGEATYPGAFHCADVHEDVLAAIIRLDETKAFLTVKPLYGSLRHVNLLSARVSRGGSPGW
jgi:hypothetical protein